MNNGSKIALISVGVAAAGFSFWFFYLRKRLMISDVSDKGLEKVGFTTKDIENIKNGTAKLGVSKAGEETLRRVYKAIALNNKAKKETKSRDDIKGYGITKEEYGFYEEYTKGIIKK